ncbi:MAG: hypothetical protein JSW26_21800 [Desulfobacterales bacterium]|nr:MAG: hypothetical protein JSW26_21800 [Desulfobacterales bacterium]
MKLQKAGPIKGLNVEHRTSNVERPMWVALCFLYFKKRESKPSSRCAESDFYGSIRSLSAHLAQAPEAAGAHALCVVQYFSKLTKFCVFDVGRWTFNASA